jgi:hypothetical protein
MSETMQKVTRLTESQMGCIVHTIAGQGEVAAVVKTWDILLGEPLETYKGQVTPWKYAIPKVQWHALCEAIIHRERMDATHDAMPGGTWMNNGPSGFEEGAG